MRRIITLILLYFGVQLILPLSQDRGTGATTLLTFGFLVLAAYVSGELSSQVRLPKITGYLLAGVLFGPAALGIVTPQVIAELDPVGHLAIALIAFLAGAELRWDELRRRGRAIGAMLAAELPLTLLAVAGLLVALRSAVPFLHDTTLGETVALSALFASVVAVNSPAVTLALLSETRARGPVARTTLGIVLVADVVVVLLFSGTLAIARTVVPPPGGGPVLTVAHIAWEILGALIVGAVLGGAVALYMRFVQRELLMFAVVMTFFGAEIARITQVEPLLTLLMAGFVTVSATRDDEGRALLEAMERSANPVFVVFFALAGAAIHVSELLAIWPLAIGIVAVRAAAIFAGTQAGARWAGASDVVRRNTWLGLISQSGVALGLAAILSSTYPSRGPEMQTLILSTIALNEIVGQVLFRIALQRSGEAEGERGESREPRAASREP